VARRTWVRTDFVRGTATGALEDPDVIIAIHGHPTDLSYNPIVWQLFGPVRIDPEMWLRGLGQCYLTDPNEQERYEKPKRSCTFQSGVRQIQHTQPPIGARFKNSPF
jgi:hypothetical protein